MEYRKEELLSMAYNLRRCSWSTTIDAYIIRKIDLKEVAEMLEEYASKKEIEPNK
ncbi:MAG: hypothetical protein ACRDD7_11755 [Peptostreptococcaceae bacterium]